MNNEKKLQELLLVTEEKDGRVKFEEAQLQIGDIYALKGEYPKALNIWKNTSFQNLDLLAHAKSNIGFVYAQQGQLDEAISIWNNIKKSDNENVFSFAQANLGSAYLKNKSWELASQAFEKVDLHHIEKKQYFAILFDLGIAYSKLEKHEEAISVWKKIPSDAGEYFDCTLCNIGMTLYQLGQPQNALQYWEQIPHDSEAFTDNLRYNLGLALFDLEEYEQAFKTWENVSKADCESYARARFNMGKYYELRNNVELAISEWSVVPDTIPNVYSSAQYSIGRILFSQGKFNEAKNYFEKVPQDSSETYANTQINLGLIYAAMSNTEKAVELWGKISLGSSKYEKAQLFIGSTFCNAGEYKKALPYFKNALINPEFSYQASILLEIINNEAINDENKRLLIQANALVDNFRTTLLVDFSNQNEQKMAHYTLPNVVCQLLEEKTNFRLNSISNVNDPTEGQILNKFLFDDVPTYQTPDEHAFIACFTFSHNSLNQFRLYGKENGVEASGASVVFNKTFFSQNEGNLLDFVNLDNKVKNDNSENTLPVYRCVYFDVETGYVQLSQRDKSTFYREYSHFKISQIEKLWQDYQIWINQKEQEIKHELTELRKISQLIYKEDDNLIRNLLKKALLPIQYLIKHNAFQEEQECRMMYITNLEDKRIVNDYNNKWLYVDYQPSMKQCLDKIYLAIGARSYEPFIVNLLKDANKVRLSNNPFRHK